MTANSVSKPWLDDLFPGSGAVTDYLEDWFNQPRLFHESAEQMGVELEETA